MNSKIAQKSKTTMAILALGGAAVLGGALYWLLSDSDEETALLNAPGNLMDANEVLSIAKRLNKELFPAYDCVCQMARQMIMMMCVQGGMNPNQIPPQLKQQIFEECVSRSK